MCSTILTLLYNLITVEYMVFYLMNKKNVKFNNSGSQLREIYSGEKDVDRVAEYIEWNNRR